ncbi:hypothetical protein NY588_02270 [Curtobacterium flaccumfaciens pv. beticola]|uniref:hypothetical protein n=1 Tax=Curtobacterium flaccumfaciens TaxID=2035 RepID=UPI00349F1C84|nr:hypothetical protein [Curtobacterium flaccumfaciens pv. basellae]
MTSTLLALGAAVLAFSAGALAFDGTTGLGADVAVAAETSHDAAPVHVTKAELRRVDSIELDAEALVLRNGDDTVVKSSMRDSGLTVSVLNRLLGTLAHTDGRGRRRSVLPRQHHVHLGRCPPRGRPALRRPRGQRRRGPDPA